jgi:4-amino-4-deoxy-L-arabinose transferase-like glycosyltransferase
VTYFEGQPDMWNTKPPLLIWFQALFMKLLGVNELAVRLPSALAALFTCLTLLVFSRWFLKSFWFGFIAVVVLITSHGYVNFHAARTGDYDALLTFFTTAYCLFFFAFCETNRTKLLYFFFAGVALAALTKGITAFLFLPGLAIYSLLARQFLPLLQNKHFYAGLISCVVVVLGYYFLREAYNPGYLAAIWENEFGGRYLKANEGHEGGFWYYYNNFLAVKYAAWYLLVPAGLVLGFFHRNQRKNRITVFAALCILTFFFFISVAKTKLEWYDVPLYPFLAILTSIFLTYVFNYLQQLQWVKETLRVNIAPYLFLFLVALVPYRRILDITFKPKENGGDVEFYEIGYFLKDALKGKQDVNGQFLLYEGYNAHNRFYVKALQDKGIKIDLKDWQNLNPNDVVIVPQASLKQYLTDHYTFDMLREIGGIGNYRIIGKK